MEREIEIMRICFLEEFQSADSALSTALQRAYIIITFRVITHFDIRLHHCKAYVYSMERDIQTLRIFFLEEFQGADSAQLTALQRAYEGHQRYIFHHYNFPSYNPF